MVREPPDQFPRFDDVGGEDPIDGSGSLRVIRLEGEIDLENSDEIADRILRALGGPPPCTAALVDCGGVTLLGASAMSMMVRVQRQAEARSIALGWSRLQSLPLHALKVVGLHARLALVN